MHIVLRQYKVDPTAVEEIIRRVRKNFVPLISTTPGFVAYTFVDAGAEGLITVSTFEDRAGAEESVRIAASWVNNNLVGLAPNPPHVTRGDVSVREIKDNVQLGYGVVRRYTFNPADVGEVTRQVREGLVPRITSAPGFGIYTVLDGGEGVIVSLSAFTDRASAEASTQNTLSWVREHLGSFHPHPPQVIGGEIVLRHTRADEVRQASDRFYTALTAMLNGDSSLMSAVWAHGGDVTAMHPIGERGEGWEQVWSQFAQVGSLAGGGQVRLSNQLIRVEKDFAYEVGVEEGEGTLAGARVTINQRVTNIYRRESGEWKMVHHHSDTSSAMNDLLSHRRAP